MPKKRKDDYVTVCPKCGSGNVSHEKSPAYMATGLSNQFMQCNSCGFHGLVFPEVQRSGIPKEAKKVREKEKAEEKEQVQLSLGKGGTKYFLYIVIPVFLIAVLLLILRLYGLI